MSDHIYIQSQAQASDIEMVERKGIGHPDTICDCIAEEISVALSNYYLQEFGSILHHNVDKALLVGGCSWPAYGGGKILEPMEIILAGRASDQVNGKKIPVNEIATSAARNWLGNHLRYIDIDKDIRITSKIRKGSNELVELFQRISKGEIPLANDTSMGVGYFPYSALEKNVLKMEMLLNSEPVKQLLPFIGEDIKVMGVNDRGEEYYTIAIAFIDRFIRDINDYQGKIAHVKDFVSRELKLHHHTIDINTADHYESESIYLTVSGTSAEAGDDGEVGRGNRVNGLITPYRPMSLEAVSGKNPISHVGKIYNHFAFDLSKTLCDHGFASEAQVYMVSQIGKPINEPQLLNLRLRDQQASDEEIKKLTRQKLAEVPVLWKKLLLSKSSLPIYD